MRRAIGIVRVSQVAGREGESFASPGEQRDRITAACARDHLDLITTLEELDVSGGTPLAKRPGLREAVEAVEAGDADVIVAAYFDRLVRSLRVQDELVSRVERAGGQVLAVDVGQVTNGSAGQWLSGTMLGAVSEYQRRTVAERSAEAQTRAVARGVIPWPNIPPGYERGPDGRLKPDRHAPAVAEAFRLRADGATVAEVRAFLAAQGIKRSYHGVQSLLESKVVLGEIRFGDLVNERAHDPIVDVGVWKRVQATRQQRGPRQRSNRLLARIGVLRCGSCGRSMIAATQTQHGRRYPFYRCGAVRQDCGARATISAIMVEQIVTDTVREALEGVVGRASADQDAAAAESALELAQADMDAAIRAFGGVQDEPVALERLGELRRVRDEARDHAEHLRGLRSALEVTAARDWDALSITEQRALIRVVVDRVVVSPGRGSGRVTVALRQ